MVVQFVFEGIPVIYQGQEQDISFGMSDPYNRNALWPYNYTNTTTYQRMGRLNEVRTALISNNTQFNNSNFMDSRSDVIASSQYDVAIRKGPLLAVLTNVSWNSITHALVYEMSAKMIDSEEVL